MIIAAIDTTSFTSSVAISNDKKLLFYKEDLRSAMQAQSITFMLEEALDRSGLKDYHNIDIMSITNGPGSFTGIRVGLAAALAIEIGANVKSCAVSNFDIINFRNSQKQPKSQINFVLIDARKNQLYFQIFKNTIEINKFGKYQRRSAALTRPAIAGYKEVIDMIKEYARTSSDLCFCSGSGVVHVYDHLLYVKNIVISTIKSRIKASHICHFTYAKYKFDTSLFKPLEPLYIREADAKIANKIKSDN